MHLKILNLSKHNLTCAHNVYISLQSFYLIRNILPFVQCVPVYNGKFICISQQCINLCG